MSRKQRTIASEVSYTGVGLHTGVRSTVRFNPADPDTGVVFVRTDLDGQPRIRAGIENVTNTPMRTSLSNENAEVHTVEHVLACLAGLRVDNVIVEVDSEEVPGADGSAAPFADALMQAGFVEQDRPRPVFQVTKPMHVAEGHASLVLLPATGGLTVSYSFEWWSDLIDEAFDSPIYAPQHFTYRLNGSSFRTEVAPARTFCLAREAEILRKKGLGKGASYDNTLVIDAGGVVQNELRFADEFSRHKVLDIIGDLNLAGMDIEGHVVALRSGHALNMRMVREIMIEVAARDAALQPPLDIQEIKKILPHRYPFLLVDRILEIDGCTRAVGIKSLTGNEEFFQGHFPGRPIMPGVLIMEAMAQVAGVMLLRAVQMRDPDSARSKIPVFLSIEKVRFRHPAVPGDQLRLEANASRLKENAAQVNSVAKVGDQVVAEARFRFMIVDK